MAGLSEAQFQEQVLALCRMLGVKYYHSHYSQHSVEGFPDLMLCGRNGTVYRELKTETGTVSPEQLRWMAAINEAGGDASVWRPSDWPERITADLRALGRSSFAGLAPETAEKRARAKVRSRKLST